MTEAVAEIRYEQIFGDEFGSRYAFQAHHADIEERLKYFYTNYMSNHLHFVAVSGNEKVVGIAAVQQNPYQDLQLWLPYVTVDTEFRNQGIGRKLFEQAVKYAADEGKELELSTVMDDGLLYLANSIRDAQRSHPGVLTRIPPELRVEPDEALQDEGLAPRAI